MRIKDILQRDPASPLVNQGQARISDRASEKAVQELKGELSTFVCEGQFADGMERIIRSFLDNMGHTSQKAAWVSGFFGSGKSHLLKMLCHLWQDTPFPDGSTARNLVPAMPADLRALLRELDTAGRRSGGLLAPAGSMPTGSFEEVRLTVLSVLLRAVNLPEGYPQGQFCLWLHDQDYFNEVKTSVEKDGKDWLKELNNLYVSGPIARAVLKCDRKFASDETEARKALRAQFSPQTGDITTEQFLSTFKRALKLTGRDGRLPCTALILDEVQQYIGDSNERSVLVTEVAEAASKQLDSQVIVVAAGQSALTDVPLLHKLMDRFTIRVPLSDADVETVTRKVLLQKKPTAVSDVRKTLEDYAGEISRELQGTRIGERVEDREIVVDDYPLLPARRRFWESCFRAIDVPGTSSQLRSQLRILHDALSGLADRPITALIPGDELYEALAPEMVNTGVLLREINERIIHLSKDGTSEGVLARRLCALVFLIGKLPREAPADIGVQATKEHVADLLVNDLAGDNGKLRNDVGAMLQKLVESGVLMQVGDEYRLQTKEGSEWDSEFRRRQAKLASDEADVHVRRDTLLYAEADRIIRTLRITQGAAKEPRQLSISRDQNPPQPNGEDIPVWIRDGWSASEKDFRDLARKAGGDSPIVFVFVPKQAPEELRKYVIEAAAAEQTLNARGNPSTAEGEEARQSMEGRRNVATSNRNELVQEIVGNAKVFQGGGSELMQAKLDERLKAAIEAGMIRLFQRFTEADSAAWGSIVTRARGGADQPFLLVGHTGPTEQHPVCQQVIASVGSGKAGSGVRKALRSSPFGWPQDAIDAALIALHRSQHLTATLNGSSVPLGQLDQNKIGKAEFRVERATLSVTDRLKIRGLFQGLDIPCKAGDELAKAPIFLDALTALATSAGGAAPLPPAPGIVEIEDLKKLVGNEQLMAIKDKETALRKRIEEWKKAKELASERKPVWELVERMVKHAADLPDAAEQLTQADAVRRERMLLAPVDPVTPTRAALAASLRQVVNEAQQAHQVAFDSGMQTLAGNATWQHVPEAKRTAILAEVGLTAPAKSDNSTDEALLAGLDNRPLAARRAEMDAVPGRVQRAIELAAKYLEPKIQAVSIERVTLRSETEVREWLNRQEKVLIDAVRRGPVLLQ